MRLPPGLPARVAFLLLPLGAVGCTDPGRRADCETVTSQLRLAAVAAGSDDMEAFRDAYATALPLFTPVRDALYDTDLDSYPLMSVGQAWQLNESATMLLAARAVGDTLSYVQLEGFVADMAAALDSTLTVEAGQCAAL